eukprot:scaffold3526_cov115-Cylindrotheca_fusiformis.AAC.6
MAARQVLSILLVICTLFFAQAMSGEERLNQLQRDMKVLHAHSKGDINLDVNDLKAMAKNLESSKEELGKVVFR